MSFSGVLSVYFHQSPLFYNFLIQSMSSRCSTRQNSPNPSHCQKSEYMENLQFFTAFSIHKYETEIVKPLSTENGASDLPDHLSRLYHNYEQIFPQSTTVYVHVNNITSASNINPTKHRQPH